MTHPSFRSLSLVLITGFFSVHGALANPGDQTFEEKRFAANEGTHLGKTQDGGTCSIVIAPKPQAFIRDVTFVTSEGDTSGIRMNGFDFERTNLFSNSVRKVIPGNFLSELLGGRPNNKRTFTVSFNGEKIESYSIEVGSSKTTCTF